jgi:hypothetical protein
MKMKKQNEFKNYTQNTFMSEHDVACERLLNKEFGEIFSYHEYQISKLRDELINPESKKNREKLVSQIQRHNACLRALTRITCMAECAIYGEDLNVHEIENATLV